MNDKELNKLVRQIKKLEPAMNKDKILKGINMCKFAKIEITPTNVISGYMSFYL
jgi:hypothetical protein